MNRSDIRDALYPNCPIRNVLSRVGDKWSMLVLFTLESNDNQRFKELQRNIPDISQKMLTATLKMLEGHWSATVQMPGHQPAPQQVSLSYSITVLQRGVALSEGLRLRVLQSIKLRISRMQIRGRTSSDSVLKCMAGVSIMMLHSS